MLNSAQTTIASGSLDQAVLTSPPTPPPRDVARCRVATIQQDREFHWSIRHAVFVDEQRIFADSDIDTHDAREEVLHCVGFINGVVAGAVRLYPLDDEAGLWQGDRLAVLPAYRSARLGAPLVRFAVNTARERGGVRMLAHVQFANVGFFEWLGWRAIGNVEAYVGIPHQRMVIDF